MDYGAGPLANAVTFDRWHHYSELAAARAKTIDAFQVVLGQAAPAGLVPADLTPLDFAAEIFVVTRPLHGELDEVDPDVQRRLVSRLLTAWRHADGD